MVLSEEGYGTSLLRPFPPIFPLAAQNTIRFGNGVAATLFRDDFVGTALDTTNSWSYVMGDGCVRPPVPGGQHAH